MQLNLKLFHKKSVIFIIMWNKYTNIMFVTFTKTFDVSIHSIQFCSERVHTVFVKDIFYQR